MQYFLCSCFVILSCTSNEINQNFEKRIPIDGFGNFDIEYAYKKAQINYAGLNIIENGFDSIFIRIWNTVPINLDQQILEFSKKNNSKSWVGNYYYLVLDTANIKLKYPITPGQKMSDTGKNYYLLDTVQTMYKATRKEKLDEPYQGWELFGKQLLNTRITTAPDWTNIHDYNNDSSNNLILIEIATKDYYRIFSYPSLSANTEINQTKKVLKFIKLCEERFKIKLNM